ncbi:hypothetical protein ACXR0O_20325 [Verrucomicrobiota bacterium sgz303538]
MFQRLARIIVLLAAVQLLGGHWIALQSAAWVGMVISYSQEDSLIGALEKTFDGKHPCELCEAVKKGHSEEQSQQSAKELLKLDAVLVSAVEVPGRYGRTLRYENTELHSSERSIVPLTPPPLA